MLRRLTSLFRKDGAAAVAGPLSRDGRLRSDLWLDQADAGERIEACRRSGELPDEEAEALRHWAERGYSTFSLDAGDPVFDDISRSVERLWREKPGSVALAYQSPLGLFCDADEAAQRRPGYRISNLHSVSDGALELFLHPAIHARVDRIFGQAPVAIQSIYFEWGSGQALHRDPIHVYTSPPAHLIGAWIALEDVGPDCGPLAYVPGSHRLRERVSERVAGPDGEPVERSRVYGTDRLLERDGCRGFDNPLRERGATPAAGA